MNFNIPMPSLGADMDEGKIVEWKIKIGDTVKKNQTIALVETTKAVVDIDSFRDGVVMNLLANVGDIIQVGKTIAILDIKGDEILDKQDSQIKRGLSLNKESPRLKISPAARKMADENHIDVTRIAATGPEGEITLKDVELKLRAKTEMSFFGINLRQSIANTMSRSKKEIPHYYLKKRMHLDLLMNWLDETNKKLDPSKRLLVPVLLMRAVIVALRKYPEMNGFYKDDKFEVEDKINLGMAFSIKTGGVMAPAVLDADKMTLAELNLAIQQLAIRTRGGGLKNRELNEGTITITNVGDLGSDEVFGIIFPPQVAIIGMGRVRKEPILDRQDKLMAGFVIDITLSADHRVSDGLVGAKFLNEIDKKLNDPYSL